MTIAIYKRGILESLKWGINHEEQECLLRPINKVGSGRYSTYSVDHTQVYCEFLDELGIKNYEIGNDAPKGGQLGKYIKIDLTKLDDATKDVVFNYMHK